MCLVILHLDIVTKMSSDDSSDDSEKQQRIARIQPWLQIKYDNQQELQKAHDEYADKQRQQRDEERKRRSRSNTKNERRRC